MIEYETFPCKNAKDADYQECLKVVSRVAYTKNHNLYTCINCKARRQKAATAARKLKVKLKVAEARPIVPMPLRKMIREES